jgi:hypothetical protein
MWGYVLDGRDRGPLRRVIVDGLEFNCAGSYNAFLETWDWDRAVLVRSGGGARHAPRGVRALITRRPASQGRAARSARPGRTPVLHNKTPTCGSLLLGTGVPGIYRPRRRGPGRGGSSVGCARPGAPMAWPRQASTAPHGGARGQKLPKVFSFTSIDTTRQTSTYRLRRLPQLPRHLPLVSRDLTAQLLQANAFAELG